MQSRRHAASYASSLSLLVGAKVAGQTFVKPSPSWLQYVDQAGRLAKINLGPITHSLLIEAMDSVDRGVITIHFRVIAVWH